MDEVIFVVLRYLGNVLGAVVGIVFFFVCIGNYLIHNKPRHVVEILLAVWWTLIFSMRTLTSSDPPLINAEFASLTIAICWLLLEITLVAYGVMLLNDQRKLMALKSLVEHKVEEIRDATNPTAPRD